MTSVKQFFSKQIKTSRLYITFDRETPLQKTDFSRFESCTFRCVFRQWRISSLILYTDGDDLPRRRVREEIWAKKKPIYTDGKYRRKVTANLCFGIGYNYFAVK